MMKHEAKISPSRPCHRRPGFSFTEILFAVMILGIGFIMVAAVFPVAIKQTQETVEETTAASVAHSGASIIQRFATNANFPPTAGKVVNLGLAGTSATNVSGVPFWQAVSGNLILSTDSRFAWVPFYSRAVANNVPSPYAQVTIIAVQCRNGSNFTAADLQPQGAQPANLQGRPALASFGASSGSTPDFVSITADSSTNPGDTSGSATSVLNVAEGTYIIVADDTNLAAVTANPAATCIGNVYRVGNFISGNFWELLPGSDMKNARYKPTGGQVHVFIVGRGYNNPGGGDTSATGPAMDVAAYSTFIQIH